MHQDDLLFQDLSRHGIYQAERLLYTFLKVATRWIEQLFTRTNNRQVISICENLPYVIAYLQTLCYCLPEIKINSYRNAVDAYTSFYTVEKSVSNLFIGHYLYLLARHEEIADWETLHCKHGGRNCQFTTDSSITGTNNRYIICVKILFSNPYETYYPT